MAITALTARNVTETSAGFTITFDDAVLECVVAILADGVTVDAADLYDFEVPHSGIWYGGSLSSFQAGSYHEADANFVVEASPSLSPGSWYRFAATAEGVGDVFYSAPFQTAGVGDTTPPTLSSPTAVNVTDSSITPRVTTDEGNGTITADLYASGDLETSLAQRSQPVTQTGAQTFSAFTGLSAGTSYVIVYGHTDAASNAATTVSVPVSTYALPIIGEIDRRHTSVEVSYTATPGATGHEYRLDAGAAIDIELGNPFEISGLSAGTSYNLQMRSYDADGPSAWTSVTQVSTLSHGLDDPQIVELLPTSIRFTVESSLGLAGNSDLSIYWALVPHEDRPSGLQISEGVQSNDSAALAFSSVLPPEEPGEREILVNVGIEPEGSYTVGAVLYDDSQSAAIGAPVYLDFTAPAVGSRPPAGTAAITSVTPGVRDASVAYSYDGDDADGFWLQVGDGAPVDIGTQNPALIAGLQPDTNYDPGVRVIPYNEDGDGGPSSYASFWTWPVFTGADEFDHPNNVGGALGPHWADTHNVVVEAAGIGVESPLEMGYARLSPSAVNGPDYEVTVSVAGTVGDGALLRSAGAGPTLSGYRVVWYESDPDVEVYKIADGQETFVGLIETGSNDSTRTVGIRTIEGAAEIYTGGEGVVDSTDPILAAGAPGISVYGSSPDGVTMFDLLGYAPVAQYVSSVTEIAGFYDPMPETAPYQPPPHAGLLIGSIAIEHSEATGIYYSGMSWSEVMLDQLGQRRCSHPAAIDSYLGPTGVSAEGGGVNHGYMRAPATSAPATLRGRLEGSGEGLDPSVLFGSFFSGVGHVRSVYQSPIEDWAHPDAVPYRVDIEHTVRAKPGDLVYDVITVMCGSVSNEDGVVAYEGQETVVSITPKGMDPEDPEGTSSIAGHLTGTSTFGASVKRATGEPDGEGFVNVTMGWKFDEGEPHNNPDDEMMYYDHLIVVLTADPEPASDLSVEPVEGGVRVRFDASAGDVALMVTDAAGAAPSTTNIATALEEAE